MTETKKTGRSTAGSKGFTAEERAAMKERAKELKAEERSKKDRAAGEQDLQASDKAMAKKIHAVVTANAPDLMPKTWYGMPAWANADGKVVCFFTPAAKFKERYATFGFNADANLDDGSMWPTSWALTKLTPADEKRIGDLVKKAVS
jgi:uncharacterized protein YdhG (YjbR/CyaY superfamily)